ncbi:SurA N-terminal domain-containing protein [Paraglaciecola sp. 25GB23A]|uniref:SurA N-terminal domain-containing protein n=1 Tax=Paraglaciecola sp. 25GB23A TaxID=3156068 RepID=UPI0032AE8815
MLERIREGSQGTGAKVILGLVIFSFVFAGIGSYINSSINSAAATVNGQDISRDALEKAYQNKRAQMESQYGEAFSALAGDANYLQEFRRSVLDQLVSEKLIDQAALELGLRVSDAQIKQTIVQMEEFQIDGKFDNDRYLVVLRTAGFQPNSFRDFMRTRITREQLSKALIGTEFALPGEATLAYDLQAQTRDAKYLTVSAAGFEQQVNVSDEQIETYYQTNIASFDTEQKVSVAYVELTLDDLLPTIDVTEQELEDEYQASIANYKTEEERRVSHILLEFGDDEAAAQSKIEDILSQVKAGKDFAELAKEFSVDTFSAEKGGDIDWFGKGMMDPAFEQAAYSLASIGDVSDVVKSDFGFHIIKLTDIKAETTMAFADVKDEIANRVKMRKGEEELYSLQQRMAEVAFEIPDHLDEVAAVANKPIITTELFTRTAPPEALSSAKALNAAFDVDIIDQGVNSDLIDLGDNRLMVLRVVNNEAERTKELTEVSASIKQILVKEMSLSAAREWAQSLLTGIRAGEDISEQLASKNIAWQEKQSVARTDSELGQNVLTELFKLSEDSANNTAVVDTLSGDVTLVQVTKINAAATPESLQIDNFQRRLASNKAQLLYTEWLESLKASAEIEIYN